MILRVIYCLYNKKTSFFLTKDDRYQPNKLSGTFPCSRKVYLLNLQKNTAVKSPYEGLFTAAYTLKAALLLRSHKEDRVPLQGDPDGTFGIAFGPDRFKGVILIHKTAFKTGIGKLRSDSYLFAKSIVII